MDHTNIKESYTAMSEGLDWDIRPYKHSYYPVLSCWMDGTLVYQSGIFKDKNGKKYHYSMVKLNTHMMNLESLKTLHLNTKM